MLLSQLTFFGALCFFLCASISLWIKWRKIGSLLLALIIAILFTLSFGIAKSSILGSMRLNSIPIVMNLEISHESISRGETILDSLKSWSKILRGKKPIYTTKNGAQISVDSIGDEKSINFFKRF